MRVLIVNTSERTGGAAVAANRLMEALNNNGVKARMLVREKESGQLTVSGLPGRWRAQWHFLWERFVIWLHLRLRRDTLFEIDIANCGTDITKMKEFREADIIHLHWVNQGMLSTGDLRKIIASGKPVVWTMHDAWPATAVCHYARGCEQFHSECRDCRLLPGDGMVGRVWRRKQRMLDGKRITLVACSEWLAGEARKSALLKGQTITSIPNPIDARVFRPCDKLQARRELGLPATGRVILFVSQRVTDPRKGMDYFVAAIRRLAEQHPDMREHSVVAILGGHAEEVANQLLLPVCPLGYVSDPQRIVEVYNAADVFVLPSLEDNLPNTIMEAMACGVPCVGFEVGGIPEMIDHRKNGYVARFKDTDDLADGIRYVLEEADHKVLSADCLQKVAHSYSQQRVAARYIEVYQAALKPLNPLKLDPLKLESSPMTFSVITITYQAERCLQRTLDSVSKQSYPHIEHLIIDGASTDQTVPMAQRYQKESRYAVSVLSEPDNGLYDAMNKGLQRATGDYVVFLNAGDSFYSSDTLARVATVAFFGNEDGAGEHSELPAVVYGDTAVTDAEGNFLHLRRHRPPEQLTWKSFSRGMLVCHQAFYVRRDIAQQFPYDVKYRHSADVDWCIRVMKEAQRRGLQLVNTHAVLANFEEGGDSKQHHRASLRERYQVMSVHYGAVQTFLLHCWFVVRALMGRSGTE